MEKRFRKFYEHFSLIRAKKGKKKRKEFKRAVTGVFRVGVLLNVITYSIYEV